MFSLFIILPVTACHISSSSRPSSCQNVTVNLFSVGINFFFLSPLTSPSFLPCSLYSSVISLALSMPTRPFSSSCSFSALQSLSASQAPALSCVESLCCYQHGQSGCSRLARLLEQMTGQCQASANHCHASSRSNRWGRRRQETMITNPDEPAPPLGVKHLGCSHCFSP